MIDSKLLEALAKLVDAIVWPALITFVVIRFSHQLKDFLQSLGDISLKVAGFEIGLSRKKEEATAALVAAGRSRHITTEEETRAAVSVVQEEVTPRVLRKAAHSRVLWVDDNPDNNQHERKSLGAIGVTFTIARSTDEALEQLKTTIFDAIISDMGRPPDQRAGYTLLEKLRSAGNKTPFIIYAGSNAPEHKAEALRRGAQGSTNRPSELFEYVVQALRNAA